MPTSYPGVYKYKHLPVLARHILENCIKEFAQEQLNYAREYNVPLLKFLSQYSDEQLIEISANSLKEIFDYLVNNNAYEQIEISTERWLTNQLEVVGKNDIAAEDITLINYLRGKSLKNFAFRLYNNSRQLQELLNEIDDFILGSTTAAANTYITILKDRIQEEEEFRSKLSNALPGFIYVYDVHHTVQTFSNNKLKEILGYTSEEMKKMTESFYQTITHPADWDKAIGCRDTYSKNNSSICSFESRIKDANGEFKWIRFYETILRTNEDGEVREIIGVAFDVSGEKEVTEALAIRETQLLEAQSIAHIGSFEWYIAGNKSTTNTPEIYRIFEMQELEKFEQFMQYVHQDDVRTVEEALKQSFLTGNYECVYRYLRNGKEKIIWSKGIVTIEDGAPIKMVGTVQDVTTIKRIEAELKEKTIELEKSNQSLQQFAAIASHDLKEPIRKIAIFCSKVLNAERDKLSDASTTTLNKILDSANRMQRMIDDILQFSFIDNNQQKNDTDLEEMLSEVKDLLSESIKDKKAAIISDGLPRAYVIAPQIRQLFQNLMANALKFSRDGVAPVINFTHSYLIENAAASTGKRHLELSVADNGIGFEEKEREKIFDLFYKLHNRRQYDGSGLGLSICQKIVDKHGGKITAQSKPGEGSTFKIELPV